MSWGEEVQRTGIVDIVSDDLGSLPDSCLFSYVTVTYTASELREEVDQGTNHGREFCLDFLWEELEALEDGAEINEKLFERFVYESLEAGVEDTPDGNLIRSLYASYLQSSIEKVGGNLIN